MEKRRKKQQDASPECFAPTADATRRGDTLTRRESRDRFYLSRLRFIFPSRLFIKLLEGERGTTKLFNIRGEMSDRFFIFQLRISLELSK